MDIAVGVLDLCQVKVLIVFQKLFTWLLLYVLCWLLLLSLNVMRSESHAFDEDVDTFVVIPQ